MSNFQRAMTRRPSKNAFNLSRERKQTMNMADLIPFYVEEIIPGDRFKVKSEVLMRLSPLVSPVMHRVNVTTHFFYVPNRIVWDGWQSFITGGEDGLDNSSVPQITLDSNYQDYAKKKTLYDYMGLPVTPSIPASMSISANALPFRAYQMIYNEYYRDQNLQDKVQYSTGDSNDGEYPDLMRIRKRNWEKDYFTSCLPFAQKGDPVTAPIGLEFREPALAYTTPGGNLADAGNVSTLSDGRFSSDVSGMISIDNIDPDQTGINIEDLRTAVRLQEWLEKNARSGSRYIESIMSHFGERVPDYTAQRPIFLGGGKQPVTISEVLQTGQTTVDGGDPHTNFEPSPQGNMAGHGISVGSTNGFNAKFSEHGFVIGIMSVLPRTAYQNGRDRMWSKKNKFDYYWPEFAQLGEQEVPQSEIYHDFVGGSNNTIFGYQSRYAEYKYGSSKVCGDFRDQLAFWHLGRIFDSVPALNSEFIEANPREDIFAIEDETEDHLYVQIYNSVKAVRPIPLHNVPTL